MNVALERIKASLETDVTGLQLVIDAYTLVFASSLLTAGVLGDHFGAKRIFVSGFAGRVAGLWFGWEYHGPHRWPY